MAAAAEESKQEEEYKSSTATHEESKIAGKASSKTSQLTDNANKLP